LFQDKKDTSLTRHTEDLDETGGWQIRKRRISGSFYENLEVEKFSDIAKRLATSPTTAV
jgi:hypothetical protein